MANVLPPVPRGDSRNYTAIVYSDKTKTKVYDLSSIAGAGLTFRGSLSEGGTPFITKTVGTGIVITDAVNGKIMVNVTSADTGQLWVSSTPIPVYWALVLTDISGNVTTIDSGTLPVVTK